jgi:hypothetical protein
MAVSGVKFDWSLLDRIGIASHVATLAPEIVGVSLTNEEFHQKVIKHLKKVLPLRFKKNYNVKVEENYVWVGGTYYSNKDEDKEKCIELVFEYSAFFDNVCLTRQRFRNFSFVIADTLLHEIIHMRQYRRRNFKVLPDYASTAEKTELRMEQVYLGGSDEIDAYGFNIACELIDKFKGNEQLAIEYLSEDQKGLKRRHNSWRMYLKAFQHNHDHPIIKRVKSKVVRYLPQAKIGKPYRNKDWIDR